MDYFAAPDNTFKFCNGTVWASMSGGGSGVPAGAIMAFDLTVCPAGWSEYTQARGRFLRGIDNGAGNDPDGTRVAGSVQGGQDKDTINILSANLSISALRWRTNDAGGAAWWADLSQGSDPRPKNVAVLFCRKS
jgi:hypothetical protein